MVGGPAVGTMLRLVRPVGMGAVAGLVGVALSLTHEWCLPRHPVYTVVLFVQPLALLYLTAVVASISEQSEPEDILDELDTFLDEHDHIDVPVPSADAVRDDYHAHRHHENLERLAESGGE